MDGWSKNLPKPIAAATGVDALCHAIECFTSAKANPISDTFALEALDLIMNNIIEACTNPESINSKTEHVAWFILCRGSNHSIRHDSRSCLSYPLGGKYHIAHGVSNAILLTPVMKFNEPAIKDLLAVAYDRVIKEGHQDWSVDEKSSYMISQLGRNRQSFGNSNEFENIQCTRRRLGWFSSSGHGSNTSTGQQQTRSHTRRCSGHLSANFIIWTQKGWSVSWKKLSASQWEILQGSDLKSPLKAFAKPALYDKCRPLLVGDKSVVRLLFSKTSWISFGSECDQPAQGWALCIWNDRPDRLKDRRHGNFSHWWSFSCRWWRSVSICEESHRVSF